LIFLQNRVRRRLLGNFENFLYLGSDGCVFFEKIGGSADRLTPLPTAYCEQKSRKNKSNTMCCVLIIPFLHNSHLRTVTLQFLQRINVFSFLFEFIYLFQSMNQREFTNLNCDIPISICSTAIFFCHITLNLH